MSLPGVVHSHMWTFDGYNLPSWADYSGGFLQMTHTHLLRTTLHFFSPKCWYGIKHSSELKLADTNISAVRQQRWRLQHDEHADNDKTKMNLNHRHIVFKPNEPTGTWAGRQNKQPHLMHCRRVLLYKTRVTQKMKNNTTMFMSGR